MSNIASAKHVWCVTNPTTSSSALLYWTAYTYITHISHEWNTKTTGNSGNKLWIGIYHFSAPSKLASKHIASGCQRPALPINILIICEVIRHALPEVFNLTTCNGIPRIVTGGIFEGVLLRILKTIIFLSLWHYTTHEPPLNSHRRVKRFFRPHIDGILEWCG